MNWQRRLLSGPMKTLVVATALCLIQIDAQCFSANDSLTSIPTYHDISGMINFHLTLFRDLYIHSNQDQNVFISPYSIYSSLLLVYLGSEGRTRAQMEIVLGVDDKMTIFKTWKVMEYIYNNRSMRYTFDLANRAFVDPRISLNPCVTNYLHDEIKKLELSQTFEASETINKFIRDKTRGKISQLVQPQDLQRALVVLANAAAYNGTWRVKFNRENTVQGRFYNSPEDFSVVPMMNLVGDFSYGKSGELGAQVIELPYSDGYTSMYLLLPGLSTGFDLGLAALISRLTPENLRSTFINMRFQKVNLKMPKFKLQNGMKDSLKESLFRMGIRDLFTNMANLTTLAPFGGLKVSQSIHEAHVEVNEEGTEASAATVFVFETRTRPSPTAIFKCNRPFLFVICDNFTGNILFIGAYRGTKN